MKRTVLFNRSLDKNIRYNEQDIWRKSINGMVCGSCLEKVDTSVSGSTKICPHCGALFLATIRYDSENNRWSDAVKLTETSTELKFIGKNKMVAKEYKAYDFIFGQINFLAEIKIVVEENESYIPPEKRDDAIDYPTGLKTKYYAYAEPLEPIFVEVTHEFSYDIYKKPNERYTLMSKGISYDKSDITQQEFKRLLKEICNGNYGLCGMYDVKSDKLNRIRNSNRLASTNLALFTEPTLIEELAVKNNIKQEDIIIVNPEATTLHDIMGISKKLLKDIREGKLKKYGNAANVIKAYHKVGDNYVGALETYDALKKLPDLSPSRNVVRLYKAVLFKKHNYDINRLIEYLTEDLKWHQGIISAELGLELLHDYLNMCDELEMPIFDKYPKSLKKAHDVVLMRYNDVKKDLADKNFTVETNKYSALAFKHKNYSIIPVKSAKELVYEGSTLRHCVGSYASSVANGNTMIFFLRLNDEIDTPLVTLELNHELQVVQRRGAFNRSLTAGERTIVEKWENSILSNAVKDIDGNYILLDKKKEEIA